MPIGPGAGHRRQRFARDFTRQHRHTALSGATRRIKSDLGCNSHRLGTGIAKRPAQGALRHAKPVQRRRIEMTKTRFQSSAQMPNLFAESAKVMQARCAERKPAEREVGARERDAFYSCTYKR